MTPQERIKAEAERFTKDEGHQKAYIAGATAEHERNEEEIDKVLHSERNKMQAKLNESDKQWAALLKQQHDRAKVLADALEFIKNNGLCSETTDVINKALEQWEGKEVGDETCGICKEKPMSEGLTVCNECYENFDGDRRGFWKSDVYQ